MLMLTCLGWIALADEALYDSWSWLINILMKWLIYRLYLSKGWHLRCQRWWSCHNWHWSSPNVVPWLIIHIEWEFYHLVQGGGDCTDFMLPKSTHDGIVPRYRINHIKKFLEMNVSIIIISYFNGIWMVPSADERPSEKVLSVEGGRVSMDGRSPIFEKDTMHKWETLAIGSVRTRLRIQLGMLSWRMRLLAWGMWTLSASFGPNDKKWQTVLQKWWLGYRRFWWWNWSSWLCASMYGVISFSMVFPQH